MNELITKLKSKLLGQPKPDSQKEKTLEILDELERIRKEKEVVEGQFELETDFDLIDVHIMKLKALNLQYERAIKTAKQQKLVRWIMPHSEA